MDRQKLKNILLKNQVPEDLYSLEGGLPNEAYCIEKENDKWHVYYSERGQKRNIGYFENEADACFCLLNKIKQ